MFKNKNTHLQFPKKEPLFVYNLEKGSAPQIAPGELARLKGKAETGELNVSSLANRANFIFKSFEDRLAEVPKAFRSKLKQQIVNYFLNTADNFDKNAVKGLDKKFEFRKYRGAALSKMTYILNKYAPSKAMIKARRKERRSFKDYQAQMEMMSRGKPKFTSKNDAFSTAGLTSPERIQDEVLKIRSQTGTMQEEGGKMLKKIAITKNSHNSWKSAGLQVKTMGRFYGGDSRKDINTDIKDINKSDILKRFQKKQKAIEAHGERLIAKGKLLKKIVREERDKELAQFDKKTAGKESKKLKNKEQYKTFLQARIDILAEKGKLVGIANLEKKILVSNRNKAALVFAKKDRMKMADDAMGGAVRQIDVALQNQNLTKEARARLLKNKKLLTKKQGHLAFDMGNAERYEKQIKESDSYSKRREIASSKGCIRIDDYLATTLDPSISALDDSLRTLEIQQLENGTEREQILAKYAKYDDVVDRLNAGVADNVLQNNLSNSFLTTTLDKQLTSVKSLSNLKKVGFFGKVSASFDGTSDGIKWYLKDNLVDKGLDPFAKWLGSSDIPVLKYVGKIAGMAVTAASALVELSQELLSTAATVMGHPIETLKGLSMLFRPSTAGKAWGQVFSGMAAKNDWKKGNYIKALTKTITNILLTVTGATAVKGGLTAARSALIATRGLGLLTRTITVTGAFFKGIGGSLRQTGRGLMDKAKSTTQLLFTKKGLQSMATSFTSTWEKGLDKVATFRENSRIGKMQKAYNKAVVVVRKKMIGPPPMSTLDATKALVAQNRKLADQAYAFVKEMRKPSPEAQFKHAVGDYRTSIKHTMNSNPSWSVRQASENVLARRPELHRKLLAFKKKGLKWPAESDLMKQLSWDNIRDTKKIAAWKKKHRTRESAPEPASNAPATATETNSGVTAVSGSGRAKSPITGPVHVPTAAKAPPIPAAAFGRNTPKQVLVDDLVGRVNRRMEFKRGTPPKKAMEDALATVNGDIKDLYKSKKIDTKAVLEQAIRDGKIPKKAMPKIDYSAPGAATAKPAVAPRENTVVTAVSGPKPAMADITKSPKYDIYLKIKNKIARTMHKRKCSKPVAETFVKKSDPKGYTAYLAIARMKKIVPAKSASAGVPQPTSPSQQPVPQPASSAPKPAARDSVKTKVIENPNQAA